MNFTWFWLVFGAEKQPVDAGCSTCGIRWGIKDGSYLSWYLRSAFFTFVSFYQFFHLSYSRICDCLKCSNLLWFTCFKEQHQTKHKSLQNFFNLLITSLGGLKHNAFLKRRGFSGCTDVPPSNRSRCGLFHIRISADSGKKGNVSCGLYL